MASSRLVMKIAVWLCAAASLIALSATSAQAAVIHNYLFQISEVPAEGPKGEPVPLPGPLGEPSAMTVDSGNLWVAESTGGKFRVDQFNASSGAFVEQLAQPGPSLNYFDNGIAVGHATGETELYVGADAYPEGNPEGAVAVYSAGGQLQAVWNGADTPNKAFSCFECNGLGGVAVDNSTNVGDWAAGDVYVSAPLEGVVDVFKPEAGGGEKYVTQLTGPEPGVPFSGPYGVAVSAFNGDVLVVDGSGVDVFEPTALNQYALVRRLTETPSGPFKGREIGGVPVPTVTADDGNGDIYVTEEGLVDQFNAEGAYLGRLTGAGTEAGAFGQVTGIAIDPATHNVYVGDRQPHGTSVDVFGPSLVVPDVTTGPVSNLRAESATLNGTVNPRKAGEATCQFVWGLSTSLDKVAPCPVPVAEGEGNAPVSVALSGLQPDTTYHYRLQASNAHGTNPGEVSQDHEFTTPGPGIHETDSKDVASTSAELSARIDPHGARTTYYFEYGTSTSYGDYVPARPGAPLGSGEGDVEVTQPVEGLSAATVYHYRVVAVSELSGVVETFAGPDETFTTQAGGGGFSLPDGRAWEMVSPSDKHGAQILAIGQYGGGGAVIQAAAGGAAITYVTTTPTESKPQGFTNYMQVLSTRASSGWRSRDIGIPHESATELSVEKGEEYRSFSEDLSLGALQPFGAFMPSLSAEASGQTVFLHTNYMSGDVTSPCATSCYRPLVTGAPGYANVPPGTTFGDDVTNLPCPKEGEYPIMCGPYFLGATPDLSHIVLESDAALTATPTGGASSLYEWSGGKLALVSVLPDGKVVNSPTLGSFKGEANVRRAISEDGSRIVWSERQSSEDHLYMRDTTKEKTIQLDAVQGGSGEGGVSPVYQIASTDGSHVFFTDEQRLTVGSSAGNGQADLYECDMIEVASKLKCELSDLTPPNGGESANVQGWVPGASEDGSWVYFVAKGALASGAVRGDDNLYVRHDGITSLVATLSGADYPVWNGGEKGLAEVTARVSPDGRRLAFMSLRELTGYNTRDAVTGVSDEEVYLYDGEANAGSGRLVCASCNPTGARPVGAEFNGPDTLVGGDRVWSNRSLAANIPGWTPETLVSALYQSRYLSDSGRLFFNSSDALVPQDVNGAEDVYQYEPPGVGTCRTTNATYSERSGGCVDLISAGKSAEESGFLDASQSGSDVFFLTTARLSGADRDTALDVYDAHECTVGSPCLPVASAQPPACDTADSCKGSLSPQPEIFGSPASATFTGAGNVVAQGSKPTPRPRELTRAQKLARALRACRKKQGKRRAACRHRGRVRYGAKSSRVNAIKKGRG